MPKILHRALVALQRKLLPPHGACIGFGDSYVVTGSAINLSLSQEGEGRVALPCSVLSKENQQGIVSLHGLVILACRFGRLVVWLASGLIGHYILWLVV